MGLLAGFLRKKPHRGESPMDAASGANVTRIFVRYVGLN